ncbi:MAG TPA: hypothetical protein ENH59_10680 [Bacteroidetes bacterium]|nr:hypothetical protein [Bacteroidota bacterium]
MKIGIHHREGSFSKYWIEYCESRNIPWKRIDCYKSDVMSQLSDCDAFMWHHFHISPKDTLFAKQLLYSVEMSGRAVYPDFRSNWHFDDKLGQKYLLEAVNAPMASSYAFFSKHDALEWIANTTFPKVFKLRGGSGSDNVKLVKTKREARVLVNRAFGKGFRIFNAYTGLKERLRQYKKGKADLNEVFKGIVRFFIPTPYSIVHGRERGYIYFQDFIPDNTHDIRVTYVFNRCFALRRNVRPGDFRASGSGMIDYDMSMIPEEALKIAFSVANRLKLQCAAFDFVLHNGRPLIAEVSYGFGYDEDQFNHGYWDEDLDYHPGTFNPYAWMVDGIVFSVKDTDD